MSDEKRDLDARDVYNSIHRLVEKIDRDQDRLITRVDRALEKGGEEHKDCRENLDNRVKELELWRRGVASTVAAISTIVSAIVTVAGLLIAWLTGRH